MVAHVCHQLAVSERRACKVLGQDRKTQRRIKLSPSYEKELTADIIDLAGKYGRYGYRRITALLNNKDGLACESQASSEDLEKRMAQSPQETAKTQPFMAK